MAEVFWLKRDHSGDPAMHPRHVPMPVLLEKLVPFEKRFSDRPPGDDPAYLSRHASDTDPRVVVRINEEDVNSIYPDAGYYYIAGISPEEARDLFGLDAG